ncbi:MAG: nuclear transport factor 2 family protein [Rhodospirillales bacterium]
MSNSARLDGLQRRLRALADIEAIETLKARYWRALDLKRPDDVRDCLAEDVVVDFEGLPRCEGRDAFMAIARAGAARPLAFDMHHGENPPHHTDRCRQRRGRVGTCFTMASIFPRAR